jgi:hypothetical protein
MNLKEQIRKVLREQRDFSDSIVKYLNVAIISQYENICKVEVKAPWNRKTLGNQPYEHYRVTVFFIGDSRRQPDKWTKTRKEELIMDEIWNLIYDTFGLATDMFSAYVKNCDETIETLNENTSGQIRKVLREQRDFSDSIVKYLNVAIISRYENICKVEVTAPWNREPSSSFYSVKVFFVGDLPDFYGILDEIWEIIYETFGVGVDLYPEYVKNCDETIETLNENTSGQKRLREVVKTQGISMAAGLVGGIDKLFSLLKIKGSQEDMIFLVKSIMDNEVTERVPYCNYEIIPTRHSINLIVYTPMPENEDLDNWSRTTYKKNMYNQSISNLISEWGNGLVRGHNINVSDTGDC